MNNRPAETDSDLSIEGFADQRAYESYLGEHKRELHRRREVEARLVAGAEAFEVPGFCHVCDEEKTFAVDWRYSWEVDGKRMPNWREHLVCPGCAMNNRMRASIHLLHHLFAPQPSSALYLTEQTTATFAWFARNYTRVVGSEYLGDRVDRGDSDSSGIRNEDLTALSFASGSFDLILSFDVLEHVPDYPSALGECSRVLRPGGALIFSVPFRPDLSDNLVRAAVGPDGEIRHLMEPEYHGDPLQRTAGCLAFYHFGWELLDRAREQGFESVRTLLYWSRRFGYLGEDQLLFIATKPE